MKTVIFINGFAESGKDTAVNFITKHLEKNGTVVSAVSSIDPIRNMLREAGFPVDTKTPDMRALLAEVGDSCEKYCGTKTSYAVGEATKFLSCEGNRAVFVHVREPEMINKMIKMLDRNILVIKLLVTRPGYSGVTSNRADMDVMKLSYDSLIRNDGTLEELDEACRIFVNDELFSTNTA